MTKRKKRPYMTEQTIALLRYHKLLQHVEEWIADGWGLEEPPTDEQAAAALLQEAKTQDECVKAGESVAEYPIKLRRIAYAILGVVSLDQIIEAAKSLMEPADRDVSDEDHGMLEYERAACEVVARVMLDELGIGESTEENVPIVAKRIGVKNPHRRVRAK